MYKHTINKWQVCTIVSIYNIYFTSSLINKASSLLKKVIVQYTRAQVVKILKEAKLSKQNLTIEEGKAIQELQQYNDIIIISADKGNYTVVLDRSEYHNKISIFLQDSKTYNIIKKNSISCIEKHLNNFIWK